MTDIRRTVLWVVFASSLLFLWDAWNTQNGHSSLFNPGAKRPVATAPATGVAPSATGAAALPSASGASATVASAAVPAAAASAPAAELVTVTTDTYKATLDSRGGSLVRLELLQQKIFEEPNLSWYQSIAQVFTGGPKPVESNVVLFDHSASHTYMAQTGLLPASLPNHETVMTVRPGERTLKPDAKQLQVVFESPDTNGVRLVKTYTFTRGAYTIGVKHEVNNTSAAAVSPQLYMQLLRDNAASPNESSFYSTFTGPALYTDASKFKKIEFKDIDKGSLDFTKAADNGWAAMVQHYFASAWLLPGQQQREFFVNKLANTNLYSVGMLVPLGSIAPGAAKAQDATLFAGPQEEKKLAALAPGLELVKDYGYLKLLAEPLFWLLDQLHSLIGNWGWAIVALVVVLKIAFYWLNASAYRSMAKMKAVNPKIAEMRERLKDKPQQMQQEMMRIYREEKINPLGGCLPIFVQMPFFIALYWVLLSSVEMRHAPWVGWIHDLSAKDPYFILPLVMTASTMFQTWLNPAPPDPVQAKMMWIMPLAFSVMFFAFPSGLVLYWVTNNILSIAQQWFINKRLGVTK
ncbi:membrane protein insertase YidC [Ideonella sp. BN130291]|uniref:membrane protein insertase YidC n=1 Tax=Ideonella sp. BN130291 TaxID=3112940 RepID=UPI002E2606C8|nr:membrane protein insertase YidC [Ideonella sp. BN130291]